MFRDLAYSDPTGRRLQPSSVMGLSDQAIPKRGGFLVRALKAPWSIQAKVAAVRLMICDAIGHRRLRLDPKSKRVIRRQATAICPTRSGMPAYTSSHQRMPSSLVITAMSGFSV